MYIHLETPSLFKLLLQKVKKEGKEFSIDTYGFIFRYANVQIGTIIKEGIRILNLDPNVSDENVKSLVFDVLGLHDEYVTEIEVLRDTMYISPERSEERVEMFQMKLKERYAKLSMKAYVVYRYDEQINPPGIDLVKVYKNEEDAKRFCKEQYDPSFPIKLGYIEVEAEGF